MYIKLNDKHYDSFAVKSVLTPAYPNVYQVENCRSIFKAYEMFIA